MGQEPDSAGLRAMYVNCTLTRSGGIPAHGDPRTAWDAGSHPDQTDPEYR